MAIIDVCTYNGEKDLWDIHYNVLKPYVDEFIVVEFDRTFSGHKKIWPTDDIFGDIEKYPKTRFVYHTEEQYEKYRELAESSPNTQGAEHWKREFMQKESIKDALTHLKDDDIVFIGDVDEVWNPKVLKNLAPFPVKLQLDVYCYYLNNRSNERFFGTLCATYGQVKDQLLNHLRSDSGHYVSPDGSYSGWHFTSMGGPVSLRKKLEDSYTHESYATPTVLENLEYNIENGRDFLGRDFTYQVDESQWPQYLKDNRAKYEAYLK